jgi:pyruvate dehydrogenase (quinone)
MAKTVGDFVVHRLREWGIKRVFAFPGDGILGIMAAFDAAGDEPRFVQVRHEEMAAFMACAHAKFTGEVGVCLATSGPGAIHLLNGLYDAQSDHQPVVAIVGQAATTAIGGAYQQEVDLQSLFKDVAKGYVVTVASAGAVRHCIDRAIRIARSERCVTCVIIPKDLQEADAVPEEEHAHNTLHSGVGWSQRRAAEVLNAGKKVAMLVGAGCMNAAEEVTQVADLLGAGIAKALLGKAVLPDEQPGVTGSIGLLGTKPSWEMMQACDTLLMVGSSFPYSEFLPQEGKARGVQIDLKGRMLSIRYPMEVCLEGDAAETLRALLPLLKRKPDRSFREQLDTSMHEWRQRLEAEAQVEARPLSPAYVYWELGKRIPDRAIFCADSGSTATWYARYINMRAGMLGSLSGNLATMGPAMPYAVSAKFAYPDRPVFALAGDGAMQMNGINTLITVSKYWKEWKDPRFYIVVLNNRDLNMVTWEMRVDGMPRFEGSQQIPDFPFAQYAESLGLRGIRLDNKADVPRLLEQALNSDRPTLIEAYTDPEFPMMPPHITLKEATGYAKSVLKGDPSRGHMIGETVKTAIADVFGHGKKKGE